MVSYSTWDKGDSSRQETFRQEISRLRFAALEMTGEGENYCVSWRQGTSRKSFLFDVGQRGFITAGNCLRMVSYSTWEMGIHRGRKLFANSFPSGMGRLRIIVTGNYLRMVSYSTWDKGDSSRQETSRKSFLSGMGRLHIIAAGNYQRMVSYPAWEMGIYSDRKLFANSFPSGMGLW